MPLSWNEIRSRAIRFSKDWENVSNEDAEAKSFLDGFFEVFGISRRRLATFEKRVKKIDNKDGFIDLLWKGQILVEMKSKGKNLDKAYTQAKEYFPGLTDDELPRCILVCDFEKFRLYDLEENTISDFLLKDFQKNIKHFGFLIGMELKKFAEQDPVNIKAAEKMGKLHDELEAIGYKGHVLELYLVRLVFCLFADDTGIFERDIFHDYIKLKTKTDGSDLASCISELFYILNTPSDKRLKNIDEDLDHFPYVNGKLFEETLPPASFDSNMRNALLDCCLVDWSKISPAIFGSLFQSVMNPQERRNLGAHYTSEKNILKLIKPLFLDELWERFEKIKNKQKDLVKFHEEISTLRFLDPACGCGNFLIVAYRELRLLELEIIKKLYSGDQQVLKHDLDVFVKVNVHRFYGIEYEEFPAQIAQVAMWLIDHQMNTLVSETFGENYIRLPLKQSANITQGNALRLDWHKLIDPIPWEKKEQRFEFIFGNPPFVGTAYQNVEQKEDVENIFLGVKSLGMLDYVTCWYIKAALYLQQFSTGGNGTRCAFVSTNSISQGEQVGILWNVLYNKYKIKIQFAHRTFRWNNEARGVAGVHVVIIGFSNFNLDKKIIFEYETINSEPHQTNVSNINPYLVEGKDLCLTSRTSPICNVPKIGVGSAFLDGGFLILSDDEKKEMIKKEPETTKYIRQLLSADEFINNKRRWCLWLKDISPNDLKQLKNITHRIHEVKEFRSKSKRKRTLEMSKFPSLLGEERQPDSDFLLIPKVSSENRKYIPIGFVSKKIIVTDKVFVLPNCKLFHFGVITSEMHMAWMKYTAGRLESRFSYSNTIVYNNYPWPESPSEKQKQNVEEKAQQVLDVRKKYPESSLADLYNPLTMPPDLVKAHNELDKAVDQCYRSQPFTSETKRIEFLFELYDRYVGGLFGGKQLKK